MDYKEGDLLKLSLTTVFKYISISKASDEDKLEDLIRFYNLNTVDSFIKKYLPIAAEEEIELYNRNGVEVPSYLTGLLKYIKENGVVSE